jgi:hypothetical protein
LSFKICFFIKRVKPTILTEGIMWVMFKVYRSVQNPWEADSFSTSQAFHRILFEPEGLLPCLQERATCVYPESYECNLCHLIVFKIHFNIILQYMPRYSVSEYISQLKCLRVRFKGLQTVLSETF